MSDHSPLERAMRSRPTDEETARRAVRPYRHLSARERFAAFEALLREVDTLLAGRPPIASPDDAELWRHWKDPLHGRPR